MAQIKMTAREFARAWGGEPAPRKVHPALKDYSPKLRLGHWIIVALAVWAAIKTASLAVVVLILIALYDLHQTRVLAWLIYNYLKEMADEEAES